MGKSLGVPEQTPKVDNGNKKSKTTYRTPHTKQKEFERCAELAKYYFDILDNIKSDKFNETVREILIYIGSKYAESGDIVCALDNLETIHWKTTLDRPIAPDVDKNELMDLTDKNI